MWKENYRLGVEKIDAQHKMLFDRTGELIQEIEGPQRKEIYQEIIEFLEDYVATHFQDEEAYQEEMGFEGREAHKRQHREFTNLLEEYVVQLEESEYAPFVVKHLAGTLSAWLVYHVVNEDLKYTGKAKEKKTDLTDSYMDCFANSTVQVLEAMIGLDPKDVDRVKIHDSLSEEDIFVEIRLVGELSGRVVFGFTKEFSSRIIETMMSFVPEEIDELVYSALAEMSNIASGNGTIAISQKGTACDIQPPKVLENGLGALPPHEEVRIETKIGKMTIGVYLD